MAFQNYLAMDFGAGSGRGIIGSFDGETIRLQEIHRFKNYFVDQNGTFFWDALGLFQQMLIAIGKSSGLADAPVSIGIDTWGTDYGMIADNGQLLGNCRCMRNADDCYVRACERKISMRELFSRTGIQMLYGNTVFQLFERAQGNDPALKNAAKMLMMPELLAYFLTGDRHSEYTIATTSMLYNVHTRTWDAELARRLGIPTHIFADILMPASTAIPMRTALCEQVGIKKLDYIPVGTHDTASAVAAIPLDRDVAFCSSGTWSIFGIERDEPLLDDAAFNANFSNEGTVDGKVRLLKNIMGMWILQQCQAEWEHQGSALSWDEITALAADAAPMQSFINLEEPEFYRAGDMPRRVREYCRRTKQHVPESIGEIARCVYESLAMRYRYTMDQLEAITGRRLKALHIVGGGSQNALLNRFAANAIGRPVYAGPTESACIGNALVQACAIGELSGLAELRQVVKKSFQIDIYEPKDRDFWEEKYQQYKEIAG